MGCAPHPSNQRNPSTCGGKQGCCPIGGSQGFNRTSGLEMTGRAADPKFFFSPLKSKPRAPDGIHANRPPGASSHARSIHRRHHPTRDVTLQQPGAPHCHKHGDWRRGEGPQQGCPHRGVPGQRTPGPKLRNQEWSCIPCCHAPTAAAIAAGPRQCSMGPCWKDDDGWKVMMMDGR